MIMNKIMKSLLLSTAIIAVQLPYASTAMAEEAKKEQRKTQIMSPSVGKKVVKAFDAYNADDVNGALTILLDIEPEAEYDKATVSRYLGVMYASEGDEEKGISYLKAAIAPDILNPNEQSDAYKLLADLYMATEKYGEALKLYYDWMAFTGKSDGNTWVKIAQAHFQLNELDKVISPADKAIAAFGDKQNQNPYVLKIQSYYERKMYKDAIKTMRTVLQLFPDNKTWWVQLGMFYLLIEDYPNGLAVLELAYKQDFLETEQQIKTLASLYTSNDLPFKAAQLLEKNIDSGLVKRDFKNLAALANAWHSAMDIGKAAKYYGEVARLTNDARYYRRQGTLLKQDEQYKSAIVALNKAIQLGNKEKEGQLYLSIAESHFYLSQYKSAYSAIKKAAADPKTKKMAKGWMGYIENTAQRKGVKI